MTRLLTILILLARCASAFAADRYVRQGASGSNNGTDWNNAWTNTPAINWSAVNAGDTVWVAGAVYTNILINDGGGTAANRVFIKRVRATNSVPAAAAGWNASYDSQVTFSAIDANTVQISVNGWTIDGQIPNGIIITNRTAPSNNNGIYLVNPVACSSWSIINCGILGANLDAAGSPPLGDRRGIHFSSGLCTNIYMGHLEIAYLDTLLSTLLYENATFEYLNLHDNWAHAGGPHNNIQQTQGGTNVVWRFNDVHDFLVECIMMDFVNSGDAPHKNWQIYGNRIHDGIAGGVTRFLTTQYVDNNEDIHVGNNTFANLETYIIAIENGGSWGTGCWFSNNICFSVNSTNNMGFMLGNDDYTLSDRATPPGTHSLGGATSAIFVNMAGQNYRSVTNIGAAFPANKGVTLASAFNTDADGNTRGADGAWDIGAFEAQGGAEVPPEVPATPAYLRAHR